MSELNWVKNHGLSLWEHLSWSPTINQLEQMINLQKLLAKWNKQVNLTRLLEKEDYWIGQIFDSLWPLTKELNNPSKPLRCIDIGSGCGFPGLALAIAMPTAEITLVEAISKKANALTSIIFEIGLTSRVNVINERAEVIGQDKAFRGTFDIAMARAVASTPIVAEYLIPLLKVNGEAILFQGKWNQLDEAMLKKALVKLKANVIKVEANNLPHNKGLRHQIRLTPNTKCPSKYPRKVGVPVKQPLGG